MYATTEDNVKIYYEIYKNKGPFVVFINQIGLNLTTVHWVKDILLKNKISSLGIELRNHGHSKNGSLSINHFIKDIKIVIKKEKIKSFFLVGSCLNNPIAIEYTRQHPTQIKGLIINNVMPYKYMTLNTKLKYKIIPFALKILKPFQNKNTKHYPNIIKKKEINTILKFLILVHKIMKLTDFLNIINNLKNYKILKYLKEISIPILFYQSKKSNIYTNKLNIYLKNSFTLTQGTQSMPNSHYFKHDVINFIKKNN